jgi:nitrous oxidase accessory protein NosD
MKFNISLTIFMPLVLCCTSGLSKAQETISAAGHARLIVGKLNAACPGAQYTTITAAVNAASPGDVIEICPALYAEQLTITKPLTLRGIGVNEIERALVQPSSMVPVVGADGAVGGLPVEAVITAMNTHHVTVENLALDAVNNNVMGCSTLVAGIHYYNSSGEIKDDAVSGAQVTGCTGMAAFFPGNGFGVQVDADQAGDFDVCIKHNSIHNFTRDGIQVIGQGVTARIEDNVVVGTGPASGVFQFGVFVVNGAVGLVNRNIIHEGPCGALSPSDCVAVRSEGVTLRAVGEGTTVDQNVITNAQSGIFVNGGSRIRITNNRISDIDLLDGIDIQGTASGSFNQSRIEGNTIVDLGPVANQSCGIAEAPGTGVAGNTISQNTINDGYCGVAHVSADRIDHARYFNILYTELNTDLVTSPPPPIEPGQATNPQQATGVVQPPKPVQIPQQ